MSQPSLTYSYFDFVSSRGEPPRVLLAIHNVPYTDVRIQFSQWPERKPQTPFGTLPVLSVDGLQVSGSSNILRYIGKLTKTYPEDALKCALVDEVLEGVEEANGVVSPSLRESDSEKKAAMRKEIAENLLPTWLAKLEKVHEKNGNKVGEFIVLPDTMTVADVRLAFFVRWFRSGVLDGVPKDICDAYPRLMGVTKAVFADPRIKAYMEKIGQNTFV